MTDTQGDTLIAAVNDLVQVCRAIGEILATTCIYMQVACILLLIVVFFLAVGRRAV